MITFDHLAVTAPDLATGLAHVRSQTGLTLPAGGAHPQMATHNAIARFTDDTYLEIIAPNPAVKPPARPRWFDLDNITQPGLSAWVLRTDDIDHCIASAAVLGINIGVAMPLARSALRWRFSICDDGSVPLDGAAPLIIQWDNDGAHPAGNMSNIGLRLDSLTITTPKAKELRALLEQLGLDDMPEILIGDSTNLRARLNNSNNRKITLS